MLTSSPQYCALNSIPTFGKRIALFGGSFDPVHYGHIDLANLAISKLKLDAVVFIPTSQNPHKLNAALATEQQRLEMLSIALFNQRNLYFSDLECNQRAGPNYSVDTLKKIRIENEIANNELFFLMGADQIQKLHLWKDYKQLFQLAQIVVFGRMGVSAQQFETINPSLSPDERKELTKNYLEFNSEVSSTDIRKAIKSGDRESIQSCLPMDVLDFIDKFKIYS